MKAAQEQSQFAEDERQARQQGCRVFAHETRPRPADNALSFEGDWRGFVAEQTPPVSALDNLKTIAGIASNVAVIVGVILSLLQLASFVDNSHRAAQSAKLGALKEIKAFLEQDEEVRRKGQRFLHEQLPQLNESLKTRLAAAGTGEAFYLSSEMKDFAAVHYHYEQMGALVKLGYIDFPLIFEIIAFPDAYMDAVEPVRKLVADNWKGPGQGLPDLGSNIRFLKSCYEKSRQEKTKVPSCPKA